MTAPLFDTRPPFDRDRLASRLGALAAEQIFIGGSSWKYEGWLGQIYTRERYLAHGGFSRRHFEAECLNEYARTFPIVCGDFSFYQFPSEQYWRRLFASALGSLRFAFKVPEQITAKVFPEHPRYGAQGGTVNRGFLDAALLKDSFLAPLAPYRDQVAALILEFGTFSRQSYAHVREFVEDLDRFLEALPRAFRYSVEIGTPNSLARTISRASPATKWRMFSTPGHACRNSVSRSEERTLLPPISRSVAPSCGAGAIMPARWSPSRRTNRFSALEKMADRGRRSIRSHRLADDLRRTCQPDLRAAV